MKLSKERLEEERKRQEAEEKAKPYILSFYEQVFNLSKIPTGNHKYRCDFNFLNDYMHNIDTGCKSNKNYKFNFKNNPILAMATVEKKDKLYLYSDGHWLGADLEYNFRYKLFKHGKEEPTGLMTCDFYDKNEVFTIKILRNIGDSFYARIFDSKKNVLSEISNAYHGML